MERGGELYEPGLMTQFLTALDILTGLINWGCRFSNDQGKQMLTYFDQMLRRGRCVTLSASGEFIGFCTFFLLTSEAFVNEYIHRSPWSTPHDDPDGTLLYVDYLAALQWHKALRIEVERRLAERCPSVERAVYCRVESPDRLVRLPRRYPDVAAV